jgi:outer membrane protein OmpA-like peptidoglycan-associated protein
MMRATTGVAVLLCLASVLAGQSRSRQFEFGAFGGYTSYDKAFGLEGTLGGGARFGYYITSNIGLEADILFQTAQSVTGTSSSFEPMVGGGSLVFNLPVGGVSTFYLLGGYSLLEFGTVNPYKFTDGAFHGGGGIRLSVSRYAAIRLEGRALYTPETNGSFGQTSAKHFLGSVGFAVFHSSGAARAPSDADADGVADGSDACPGTPAGAVVDATGCTRVTEAAVTGLEISSDSDQDGVVDGPDQCPDTPAGAVVDARGCPSDADGDRVFDGIDQCPGTQPGAMVNAIGCPADEDADRVPDGVDQCPATPAAAIVDARGCPVDSDGDGVFDGLDECPGTPAGAAVDARGCPAEIVHVAPPAPVDTMPRDSDGDGVVDGVDRCPNTPAGAPVDHAGCLILFREEPGTEAKALVLRGVNFTSGRSILTRASYVILDEVAASLIANPDVRIEVAGHTDGSGSETLNLRLSQARAAAVRHYLASKGVKPERMVARGYGESEPVASNATASGKAQNRRVELRRTN